VLNRTFIPDWDYAVNGSFQTDFRNYSLLANISNVTALLSVGAFNVTVTGNLSSANLTTYLSAGDDFFFINESVLPYNVTIAFPWNESSLVTVPESGLSGTLTGVVAPGFYQVYPDVNASITFPVVYTNTSFSPEVVYTNFNGTASGSCTLSFNNTAYPLENISLDTGAYAYNLTCVGVEPVSLTGNLSVTPQFVSFNSPLRYVPFVVTNNHPSCTGSIVFNGSTNEAFFFNSSCEVEVALAGSFYEWSTSYDSGNVSLTGALFFAVTREIERFYIPALKANKAFWILSDSELVSQNKLNDAEGDYFRNTTGLEDIEIPPHSQFYFRGVLFSDGEVVELTN
jgi:hypothetical protein